MREILTYQIKEMRDTLDSIEQQIALTATVQGDTAAALVAEFANTTLRLRTLMRGALFPLGPHSTPQKAA